MNWSPRVISTIFFLATVAEALSAQVPESVQRIQNSVVSIEARRRGTPLRTATGFLWTESAIVITSYHVVAGSDEIVVKARNAPIETRNATLVRINFEADLAELRLDSAMSRPFLALTADKFRDGESVWVFGHPVGVEQPSRDMLHTRTGSENLQVLRALLDDEAYSQLQALGFPSLDLKVLNLAGDLVPGHSGAPIVVEGGMLLAIANGGLRGGKIGRGWGILANELGQLVPVGDATMPVLREADLWNATSVFLDAGSGEQDPLDSQVVKSLPDAEACASFLPEAGFVWIARTQGDTWSPSEDANSLVNTISNKMVPLTRKQLFICIKSIGEFFGVPCYAIGGGGNNNDDYVVVAKSSLSMAQVKALAASRGIHYEERLYNGIAYATMPTVIGHPFDSQMTNDANINEAMLTLALRDANYSVDIAAIGGWIVCVENPGMLAVVDRLMQQADGLERRIGALSPTSNAYSLWAYIPGKDISAAELLGGGCDGVQNVLGGSIEIQCTNDVETHIVCVLADTKQSALNISQCLERNLEGTESTEDEGDISVSGERVCLTRRK